MTSCVHETAVEHHDNQSDDVRFAKALALAARCDEGRAADTGSGTAAALRLFKPASSSTRTQHRQSVDGSGVPDVILHSIPYVVRVRCSNYRIGTGLVVQQRSESRRDSFDASGSGCGPPGWLLLTARLVTCTVTLAVVLATVYVLVTLKRSSHVFKFPTNS
jgi:hypothetical protein